MKEHFYDGKNARTGGDWWDDRSASKIQEFLRERLELPTLVVTLVMEYCNKSSGFPLWRIDYYTD
jgi:hypothetical protein